MWASSALRVPAGSPLTPCTWSSSGRAPAAARPPGPRGEPGSAALPGESVLLRMRHTTLKRACLLLAGTWTLCRCLRTFASSRAASLSRCSAGLRPAALCGGRVMWEQRQGEFTRRPAVPSSLNSCCITRAVGQHCSARPAAPAPAPTGHPAGLRPPPLHAELCGHAAGGDQAEHHGAAEPHLPADGGGAAAADPAAAQGACGGGGWEGGSVGRTGGGLASNRWRRRRRRRRAVRLGRRCIRSATGLAHPIMCSRCSPIQAALCGRRQGAEGPPPSARGSSAAPPEFKSGPLLHCTA